jgi:predicted GIY-YIG superfamily endonuclease
MGETQLYRHWDKDNNLLYVGISYCSLTRLKQHSKSAKWFKEVANVTIEQFSTRKEAEEAELKAIRTEKPEYNIVGVLPEVVSSVRIAKMLKWRKPVYKVKGKLWLPDNCVSAYTGILSSLETGKEVYTVNIAKDIIDTIDRVLSFSFTVSCGSRGFMRILASKSKWYGDICTQIVIRSDMVDILIQARDCGDIWLEGQYGLIENWEGRDVLCKLTSEWYVDAEVKEASRAWEDDLVEL